MHQNMHQKWHKNILLFSLGICAMGTESHIFNKADSKSALRKNIGACHFFHAYSVLKTQRKLGHGLAPLDGANLCPKSGKICIKKKVKYVVEIKG